MSKAEEVLEEFVAAAALGAAPELDESMSVFPMRYVADPHPDADDFIAATPEERVRIRTRYEAELEQRRQRAKLVRVDKPTMRRKGGAAISASQEQDIRNLGRIGLSAREIERRTGIGRATIARRLAGVAVQRRGRKATL